LPEIMQWVKQTYSVRYNLYDGRTGHIWGDRYASEIVAGGPPDDAEEYVFVPVVCPISRRVRKRRAGCGGGGGAKRGTSAGSPARDAEGRPRTGRRAVKPPPRPGWSRRTTVSHG
ncbi:MAG: transposase, partial [Spirochaetaceae bacterium]|nr:transposase [Spirochaetaceae bacterium]